MLVLAAALVAALAAPPVGAEPGGSDSAAVALAGRVLDALGGRERFEALPGLRWSYVSELRDTVRAHRRHAWDKHGGRHRVEGVDRHGARFVFVHDLAGGAGRAWMNGGPIAGDSLATLLARARALWANDTYWFLMPYKLLDPGVTLRDAGEDTVGGARCRALDLAFDGVGETPGDRYRVFVDATSHRVVAWEYVLQGQSPPPSRWIWEGWVERDGLWFSTVRRSADGARVIATRDLETVRAFGPEDFAGP